MAHRSPQEINQRLEYYVFGIASHFIDSAEPTIQQALIDAASRYITLDTVDATADTATLGNLRLGLPNPVDHPNLYQATDPQLAHKAWLANWAKQQQQQQRQHITYLEKALSDTQQHYQLIQETVLREPYRSRLLNRYQRSLGHFQRCLESAYTLTQSSAGWLSRLQYDKAV